MANNLRIKRLNHTYMEEISMILMEEVKDEELKDVIITGVDVTNDLSYAKVYFTLYNKEKRKDVYTALNNAASFIRGQLSSRIEIRHTPELRFIYDESEEYGEKIDKIIDNLNN
mgnify:CR=1 FL=1